MKQNKIITTAAIIIFIMVLIICSIWYQNIKNNYEKKTSMESQQGDMTKSDINKAKNFTIYDEQKNSINLENLKGKPTIINVWTTWCVYCREEMPYFDELYEKYKDQLQFLMVNVLDGNSETIENGKKFIDSNGYHFPYYYDKNFDLVYAYNLSGYPNTIFIDQEGNLIKVHYGLITKEELVEQVSKLLENRE